MTTHRQGGFTLIELVIVIVIIGIVAAVAIPALLENRAYGEAVDVLNKTYAAQQTYFAENGTYASNFDALGVDIDKDTRCVYTLSATSEGFTVGAWSRKYQRVRLSINQDSTWAQ